MGSETKSLTELLAETVRGITGWIKENPRLTKAIFVTVAAVAALLTVLAGLLSIVGTLLAAKGIIVLAGGFKALALAIPGVTFAVKVLIPTLISGAASAASFVASLAVAAAPIAIVTGGIIALGLAIRQLVKFWDELDFGEAFKGISEFFSEKGLNSTLGELFDPSALINSIREDAGSIGDAVSQRIGVAPAQGASASANVSGQIGVNVTGPGQVTSVESSGPVGLSIDSGLAVGGI